MPYSKRPNKPHKRIDETKEKHKKNVFMKIKFLYYLNKYFVVVIKPLVRFISTLNEKKTQSLIHPISYNGYSDTRISLSFTQRRCFKRVFCDKEKISLTYSVGKQREHKLPKVIFYKLPNF